MDYDGHIKSELKYTIITIIDKIIIFIIIWGYEIGTNYVKDITLYSLKYNIIML